MISKLHAKHNMNVQGPKKVGSIIYSKEINMSKVKSYIWMISKDMKKKVNGKESNMKIV